MGANFYFDKDGVVVESSSEISEGVPCISGLKFDALALYQKLNVTDDSVFERILDITQLVKKYEMEPDRIEFAPYPDTDISNISIKSWRYSCP